MLIEVVEQEDLDDSRKIFFCETENHIISYYDMIYGYFFCDT